MIGRPSIYSPKLAYKICHQIAKGESLRTVCKRKEMPAISTVMKWLLDPEKKHFAEQYELAVNARAELMFEELLEIADDGRNDWQERQGKDGSSYYVVNGEAVQRSRLRADVRKWYLSKIMPKKFGDAMTLKGDKENPLVFSLSTLAQRAEQHEDATG